MKAIINPYNHTLRWCEEFFPDRSICSLPVAGKEFAEYQIDSVSILGVDEITLLDYNYDSALKRKLGRGDRWSLVLHYLGSGIRRDIPQLLDEHRGFAGEGEVLLVMGPVLPEFESREALFGNLEEIQPGEKRRDGVYLFREGRLFRCPAPLRSMRTLNQYFELNFQLLNTPRNQVLPGYRAENGVHTGMNVVIMPGCEIKPPVVLGDNICLERDCRLEGGVVIGHDVIIDSGNVLRRCVVFDHTYIGKNMEFSDKIVASGRIIDPVSEASVDLEEAGISSGLDGGWGKIDWTGAFEYLFSLFLAVLFLIPYAATLPVQFLLRRTRWFVKCSFDLYPKLWLVVRHRGSLIRRSGRNEDFVFCFSDSFSMRRDALQQKLDDRYYYHHRNPLLIVRTAAKAFVNRMFLSDDML
ncbi:MAG: hypothetical protein HP002_11155 [Lentisphaeria bacterium]|uniref:hypothetical protein n=1 Tax=uncultured Victivallis sp. TaxID=354118 RepID=UPI001D577CE5|nr:hypothetical protein [uncultured Victivallis sp.]MBS1453926.1 hypothetical protein [Lentisphaeria bacterium]MBS5531991.1 hypothetical protein [bacterium]